jgi:ADP-ribosylglycohydrolase
MTDRARLARALVSLDGLSVGDALGERFFGAPVEAIRRIVARELPPGPWRYTDDTEMACAVVETLAHHGRVDCDALAATFAWRYRRDPMRGYGRGAHDLLQSIGRGSRWQDVAWRAFGGQGSRGNGGAMRVAPLGAYYADALDLDELVEEARKSAMVTHAHLDGQAGAIAVALAAAWVARRSGQEADDGTAILRFALARTPGGPTRDGVGKAVELAARWAKDGPPSSPAEAAAAELGNGADVCASDTVPLALFWAQRCLGSFEDTFWFTVAGLGDRDTTCAIACGIAALADPPPAAWVSARERLPLDL